MKISYFEKLEKKGLNTYYVSKRKGANASIFKKIFVRAKKRTI